MRSADCTVIETTLGELIAEYYLAFLEEYGDPELAAVATEVELADLFADNNVGTRRVPGIAA